MLYELLICESRVLHRTQNHQDWLISVLEHELCYHVATFKISNNALFTLPIPVGMCDDERVNCDRGCDFDARNRLFCYKTCAGDEKKCGKNQFKRLAEL